MNPPSILKSTLGCFLLVAPIALIGCNRPSGSPIKATNSVDDSNTTDGIPSNQVAAHLHSPDPQDSNDHETDEDHEAVEHGPGMGHGRGMGRGRGPGSMSGRRADMTTIHAMFAEQDKINRTVKFLPNGAEATTESDDDSIASLLQEHVPAMDDRVLDNNPLPPMTFHPVFVELIKHSDDYTLDYNYTKKASR